MIAKQKTNLVPDKQSDKVVRTNYQNNLKTAIVDAIRNFYLRESRPPTNYEFNIHNGFPCSDDTVWRLFGSFNNAVRSTGIKVSKSYDNAGIPEVKCRWCGRKFSKHNSQIAKTKSNFCSRSCSAKFNNKHKSTGTRRAKLEVWIERQFLQFYPDLEIIYNGTQAIQSELDVYIPSCALAFELNGIIHYQPIFGEEKLRKIRAIDSQKEQACKQKGIRLIVINTSKLNVFNERQAQFYWGIIREAIKKSKAGDGI